MGGFCETWNRVDNWRTIRGCDLRLCCGRIHRSGCRASRLDEPASRKRRHPVPTLCLRRSVWSLRCCQPADIRQTSHRHLRHFSRGRSSIDFSVWSCELVCCCYCTLCGWALHLQCISWRHNTYRCDVFAGNCVIHIWALSGRVTDDRCYTSPTSFPFLLYSATSGNCSCSGAVLHRQSWQIACRPVG